MKHFLDDVISSDVDMDGYILSIEKLIDKNNIEVLRHEILIDIAFANDFGFDI